MGRLRPHGRRQWLIATALASALGVLATTASTPQAPAVAASGDPDDPSDQLKDRRADINDRLHGAHSDLDEWTRVAGPAYLNLRKASIYGGSNEVQRQIISRIILGL